MPDGRLVNGQELQNDTPANLAFDVPHLISYVSKALDWRPGDVLATGTPSGIGFKRNPPRKCDAARHSQRGVYLTSLNEARSAALNRAGCRSAGL